MKQRLCDAVVWLTVVPQTAIAIGVLTSSGRGALCAVRVTCRGCRCQMCTAVCSGCWCRCRVIALQLPDVDGSARFSRVGAETPQGVAAGRYPQICFARMFASLSVLLFSNSTIFQGTSVSSQSNPWQPNRRVHPSPCG